MEKELGCYVYCKYGSKNRPGNFTSLNLENKIVRQYENVKNPGKCHVKILDKYLSLILAEAKERDAFYLIPLPCKPQDQSMPWYSAVPVGKNQLGAMLKEMCQEAGVLGKYSSHNLRAGGATTIYQAGVPEKLIQERTGHRSIDGLRHYERTSEAQPADTSNVVANIETSVKPIPTNSLTVQDKGTVAVHESHCTFDQGSSKSVPTIILKGCTFSGCAGAFSGPASNVNNDSVAAEVRDGINLSDIFED